MARKVLLNYRSRPACQAAELDRRGESALASCSLNESDRTSKGRGDLLGREEPGLLLGGVIVSLHFHSGILDGRASDSAA